MDRSEFYKFLRNNLNPTLSKSQVDGLEACLDEATKGGLKPSYAAAVMAEAWHETGGKMSPVVENLNYSAKRLTEVWPSRFPTVASATPYANNPQKLANKVYGGRMGNDKVNDGWTYRGRGLSQITGKDNYSKYGLASTPDKAAELPTAVHVIFDGMVHGRFTGKKLSDFDGNPYRYAASRVIINSDKNGSEIEKYGRIFEQALKNAGYGNENPPIA